MKFIFRPKLKTFKVITFFAIITFVLFYFILIGGHYESEVDRLKEIVLKRDVFINDLWGAKDAKYPIAKNYKRKDWHDWKFIEYEKSREGPGEQGKPYVLTDPDDIKLNQKLFNIEGLYVVVSDKISVNRSVPDTRLKQ